MATYNKRSHEFVFSAVELISRMLPYAGRTVEIAGNVASFALWQQARGFKGRSFATREGLWKSAVFPRLCDDVTVLEFGVASGDATRFWLAQLPSEKLQWHGFDVFTGLPTSWSRGGVEYSPPGRFDAGGAPPEIDDPRVRWHVGLVADSLRDFEDDAPGQRCIIMDLDLYEPSVDVLQWLSGRIQKGDVIYFDEIYDAWHERRALDEFLDAGHRFEPLGSTGMAAAYMYAGREA